MCLLKFVLRHRSPSTHLAITFEPNIIYTINHRQIRGSGDLDQNCTWYSITCTQTILNQYLFYLLNQTHLLVTIQSDRLVTIYDVPSSVHYHAP